MGHYGFFFPCVVGCMIEGLLGAVDSADGLSIYLPDDMHFSTDICCC